MKHKVVLVPFPFDDLSANKVRPAVCLTDAIKPFDHIVLAFITSRVAIPSADTDLVVNSNDPDFALTGLKLASTIRLHRLMTVSRGVIRRELSSDQKLEIEDRLRRLFGI